MIMSFKRHSVPSLRYGVDRQSCFREQDFLLRHSILAERADQAATQAHRRQQKPQTTNPSSPVSSPTPNTLLSNSEHSTSVYFPAPTLVRVHALTTGLFAWFIRCISRSSSP